MAFYVRLMWFCPVVYCFKFLEFSWKSLVTRYEFTSHKLRYYMI